jgi:hypothetical protein
MHFKLNGWQRLGIILSAFWAIWPFLYEGTREANLPEAFRNPDCYFIGFGLILPAWLLAYVAVYMFKWVKRGFQRTPAQEVQALPEVKAGIVEVPSVCLHSPQEISDQTMTQKHGTAVFMIVMCLTSAMLGILSAIADPVVAPTGSRALGAIASTFASPGVLIVLGLTSWLVSSFAKTRPRSGWEKFWNYGKFFWKSYLRIALGLIIFVASVAVTNLIRLRH